MLGGFTALNITTADIQHRHILANTVGSLRYLLKLHKRGLGTRRVEVDVRSPFNNVSDWLAATLNLIATSQSSTVADARTVVADLYFDPVENFGSFLAADIIEFYPSIELDSLESSITTAVEEHFGQNNHVIRFVKNVLHVILHNKYVLIDGYIYRKLSSLSIGEKIATAAANIHRHISFRLVIREAIASGDLLRHYGFVDDTLSIFAPGVDIEYYSRGSIPCTRNFGGLSNIPPTKRIFWTSSSSTSKARYAPRLIESLPTSPNSLTLTAIIRRLAKGAYSFHNPTDS